MDEIDEVSRYDVAVVGGGLAGLAAAVTAARGGARVVLLDGRVPGGRARSAERDGFTLNEGPHALYRNGVALATLTSLGIEPAGGSPDASTYGLVWDGEVVPLPVSARTMATTRVLGAASKLKLAGWFASLGRQVRRCGELSVDEWLDGEHAGDDLCRYVTAMMRLGSYAARPGSAAAAPMLRQLAMAQGGVLYVDGGWGSIVDRLVAAAASAGVSIRSHAAATGLVASPSGWEVATADGDVGATSVVIAAGGPAVAAGLLGDDPAGWVERAGPAQRAAVLDIGGPPSSTPFLLSADEPLYLSTHAPVAALAPAGQHLVTAMRYLDASDTSTVDERRDSLERHAAQAGAAGSAQRTLERFLAAPVTAWGSPVPGVGRPGGDELAGRGLWVAGDWVGEHLIADASVSSGAAAGLAAVRRSARAA